MRRMKRKDMNPNIWNCMMNLRILCLSGGGVTINVSIVTIDEPFYVP